MDAVSLEPRRVLLAGATGLIGRELLARLLDDPSLAEVVVPLRHAAPDIERLARVRPLQAANLLAPPALPQVDEVYVALGTTRRNAGSREAFARVDRDMVVALARAAQDAGARRIGVVSAQGADPRSPIFYSRIKGEMEAAVAALEFATTVFARPSLLAGDRAALGQPVRLGERLALRLTRPIAPLLPGAIRPIYPHHVAAALIAAVRGGSGIVHLSSAHMQGSAYRAMPEQA